MHRLTALQMRADEKSIMRKNHMFAWLSFILTESFDRCRIPERLRYLGYVVLLFFFFLDLRMVVNAVTYELVGEQYTLTLYF